MEWNGDQVIAEIERRVRRAVQVSAIELVNDVRSLISTPSRTVTAAGTYASGQFKGQARTKLGPRGSSRSKPGEPPHKDTGALRSSIAHEMVDGELRALCGTTLKVGRWLELGRPGGKRITAKGKSLSWVGSDGVRRFAKSVVQGTIAPRPFLRRQLKANEEKIRQRIAAALTDELPPT